MWERVAPSERTPPIANAVADALRDYDVAVDGSGPFTPTWILEALSRPPASPVPKTRKRPLSEPQLAT